MTQRGHHDRAETMRLADGRTLGWRSYGDPGDVPVLAMHGSPDSAVVWRLADTAAGEAGVRLVAPDRPGFGASTPDPGRSILDWVDDRCAHRPSRPHHLPAPRHLRTFDFVDDFTPVLATLILAAD